VLEQCAAEVDPLDIVTAEALDLLAERLITPLQIQHYLTRVLEQGRLFFAIIMSPPHTCVQAHVILFASRHT
jgi:hypothetical protein